MTEDLGLMENPCQIFGNMRHSNWESTCSSWLGMMGGPVVVFDPNSKAWVAVGFVPLGDSGLVLDPAGSIASGKHTFEIYSVDETNPRYFDYTTNIVPMAKVWPWIVDSENKTVPA